MKDLKNKYVRSVIKLGNSYAMTFPQEWTNKANLKEKSEVSLYPIDDKSIVIKTTDKEKQKTIFNIGDNWPIKLLRHALISAFKLNVDEIYLKYNEKNQDKLYKLLTELRREIIGIDFKNLVDNNEFFIYFLLDSSKTTFKEVLSDLIDVFNIIISNVIKGTTQNNDDLLLAEIDRKYSLGRRILITGLSEYPLSKGYRNLPIIQYLGDRVVLIYVKDFINESLNLQNYPQEIIKKYSNLLSRIPSLLIDIVNSEINLGSISEFYDELIKLSSMLEKINIGESFEELEIRNTIKYYLNSFQNFFDIGITRLIESEIGMVKS
ncbi:MAG: AbrB/MazE/SpoVT family DNA-binding domain-containing protein [Promethearchaeota archaeon]